MTEIIAIDPGAAGGVAWLENGEVKCVSMPQTRRDLIDFFREIVSEGTIAYIEKINGFIPGGGASQMFEFGRSVERVGCILETLGVRIIEVGPKHWQKGLSLGTKGSVKATADMDAIGRANVKAANARLKAAWKNKLKEEAQRRFPGIKVTLKNADALLILDYAREL